MKASTPAPDDVRMRGFLRRARAADAIAWVDAQSRPLSDVAAPLEEAAGRVLARDLTAPIDVPGFDRAAMDGYALRADETVGAGDYSPVSFRVIGESFPGRGFSGQIHPGEAVRIMTGAPIPAGADAVVPAEAARLQAELVDVTAAVPTGKHIGRTGEDLRSGSLVLSAGRRLRPQDVGVIASLGLARVSVVRRPNVRVLVTGNELVPPGSPKGEHEIYEANSGLLRPLIARDGGQLTAVEWLRDDRRAIREALATPAADILLISGGSSVGREDHAPGLLAELGELAIHGIAMRPSSPAGLGRIGETLVFLLPGNPVSCLCAYDFFAGRAIRRLGSRATEWPYPAVQARLTRKLVSEIGRTDYCRVRLTPEGVEPLALSGASILSSTTRADGFVIIPEESEGRPPGAEVTVYLYASD